MNIKLTVLKEHSKIRQKSRYPKQLKYKVSSVKIVFKIKVLVTTIEVYIHKCKLTNGVYFKDTLTNELLKYF